MGLLCCCHAPRSAGWIVRWNDWLFVRFEMGTKKNEACEGRVDTMQDPISILGMYLSVPIQDVTKKDWKIEDRYSCLLVFCVGIRDLFLNPVGSSLKLWFLEIRLRRKD